MQTFSENQQSLSDVLAQARHDGEVRIQGADGQTFVLKPENPPTKQANQKRSPLDIKGLDLGFSRNEIVECIREGRRHS